MSVTPPNQRRQHIYGTRPQKTTPGAADFLRGANGIAALMPAAMRMASLQKDCAAALPAMFGQCDIVRFEAGQLVLAVANAAIAAKLKQQVPKLQAALLQRGWQVDAIKLKIAVTRSLPPVVHTRALELPETAVSAFEDLGAALPDTPQNATLIAAIKAMAARRR